MNPGDIIKLGRIKLKICDIKLPGYEDLEKYVNDNETSLQKNLEKNIHDNIYVNDENTLNNQKLNKNLNESILIKLN